MKKGGFLLAIFIVLLVLSIYGVSAGCCYGESNFCQDVAENQCVGAYEDVPCDESRCILPVCCVETCEPDIEYSLCTPTSEVDFIDTSCSQVLDCEIGCCEFIRNDPFEHKCEVIFKKDCVPSEYYDDATYSGGLSEEQCVATFCSGVNPKEHGSLTGIVRGIGGSPIKNALVELSNGNIVYTNAQGRYVFDKLLVATFGATAYASGFESVYHSVVITPNDQIVQDFDFTSTTDLGTVEGYIFDEGTSFPKDNPIAGAVVYWGQGTGAISNVQGRYVLQYVQQGSKTITAYKLGYGEESVTFDVQVGIPNYLNFSLTPEVAAGCGDNVFDDSVGSAEECDGSDDDACPGLCRVDCTCPDSCDDVPGSDVCDFAWQCPSGQNLSQFSVNKNPGNYYDDQYLSKSYIDSLPVCCKTNCFELGTCEQSIEDTEIPTDVPDMSWCKCGAYYYPMSAGNFCCEGFYSVIGCGVIPGTLKGVVKDKGTEVPIDGVLIVVRNDQEEIIGQMETQPISLIRGSYKFQGLPEGTYTIEATHSAYHKYTSNNLNVKEGEDLWHNFSMESYGICESAENVDVIPAPSIKVANIQGTTKLMINWSHPCADIVPVNYTLTRISPYELLFEDIFLEDFDEKYYFVDCKSSDSWWPDVENPKRSRDKCHNLGTPSNLQWNTSYGYQICITIYPIYGEAYTKCNMTSKDTGDEFCEGYLDDEEFCAKKETQPGGYILNATTSEKKSVRARCNPDNLISPWDGSLYNLDLADCSVKFDPGSVCVQLGDKRTTCTDASIDCDKATGPLGIFTDIAMMATFNSEAPACYYDYYQASDYRFVDRALSCYSSDSTGTCFDYYSESACSADICLYGDTNHNDCVWYENTANFKEMGLGLCHFDDYSGTDYCYMCGSDNDIYRNTECSPELCRSLGSCISSSAEHESCDACDSGKTCSDYYDQESCEGGNPFTITIDSSLDSCLSSFDDDFSYSKDVCKLGRCMWYDGQCVKDGNDDNIPDCPTSDPDCKVDHKAPETEISAFDLPHINFGGIVTTFDDLLTFTAEDNIDPNVTTYYCLILGESCCPINKTSSTNSIMLPGNNSWLMGLETDMNICYYSIDMNNNTEPVDCQTLSVDTDPPDILIDSVELINHTPEDELSNLTIYLSISGAQRCEYSLIGSEQYGNLVPVGITSSELILNFTALPDRRYGFFINCTDKYLNWNSTATSITVDRVQKIFDLKPDSTYYQQSLIIQFNTSDELRCGYRPHGSSSSFTQLTRDCISDGIFGIAYCAYTSQPLTSSGVIAESKTYVFDVKCVKNEDNLNTAKKVDEELLIFTVDRIPPDTIINYSLGAGEYGSFDQDSYYTEARFKVSCKDPNINDTLDGEEWFGNFEYTPGDWRGEFGCSVEDTDYCFTKRNQTTCDSACSPNLPITNNEGILNIQNDTGNYCLCYSSKDKSTFNVESPECVSINIAKDTPTIRIIDPPISDAVGENARKITFEWESFAGAKVYIRWHSENNKKKCYILENCTPPIIPEPIILSGTYGTTTTSQDLSRLFDGYNRVIATIYPDVADIHNVEGISDSVLIFYDTVAPEFDSLKIYNDRWNEIQSGTYDAEYGRVIHFNVTATDEYWSRNISYAGLNVDCITNDTCGDYSSGVVELNRKPDSTIHFYYDLVPQVSAGFYDMQVGTYNATFHIMDEFGNSKTLVREFDVLDTKGPTFNIMISPIKGAPFALNPETGLPKITNGKNGIAVYYYANVSLGEPANITNFLYNVFDKPGSAPLIFDIMQFRPIVSLNRMDWSYNMLVPFGWPDLSGENTEFNIQAFDINGNPARTQDILSGRYFEVDTFGGNAPNFFPDIENNSIITTDTFSITGVADPVEPGITLHLNLSGQEFTTLSAPASEYISTAVFYGSALAGGSLLEFSTIITDLAQGKYIEFEKHKTQDRKRYQIVSSETDPTFGTKITISPALEQTLSDGEVIYIYDASVPEGFFEFVVQLEEGTNNIQVWPVDELGNVGDKNEVNLLVDNTAPYVKYLHPDDADVTSENRTNITAIISDDTVGVSLTSISLNLSSVYFDGSSSSSSFTCATGLSCVVVDNDVRIDLIPDSIWEDGTYNITLTAEDKAGNELVEEWSFRMDKNVPRVKEFTVVPANYYPAPYNRHYSSNNRPDIDIEFFQENVAITNISVNDTTEISCVSAGPKTFDCTPTSPIPSDGPYEIILSAMREISPGNWSGESRNRFYLTLDRIEPNVTIDERPPTKRLNILTRGTYSDVNMDEGDMIEISGYDLLDVYDAELSDYSYRTDVELNPDSVDNVEVKEIEINARAYDKAGNMGSAKGKIIYDVNAAPIEITQVNNTYPGGIVIPVEEFEVYITNVFEVYGITIMGVADNGRIIVNTTYEEDEVLRPWDSQVNIPVRDNEFKVNVTLRHPNGNNFVMLTSVDEAGNKYSKTVVFITDTGGPEDPSILLERALRLLAQLGITTMPGSPIMTPVPMSECMDIESVVARDACLINIRLVTGNKDVCENINKTVLRYSCDITSFLPSSDSVEGCVNAGQTISIPDDVECCTGLEPLLDSDPISGSCSNPSTPVYICSSCGDGRCDEWENECSCLSDCGPECGDGKCGPGEDDPLRNYCPNDCA